MVLPLNIIYIYDSLVVQYPAAEKSLGIIKFPGM